jgi:hypothetical protein
MTVGGWIFMLVSVSVVIGLATFCYYRVLTTAEESDQDSEVPQDEPERHRHG